MVNSFDVSAINRQLEKNAIGTSHVGFGLLTLTRNIHATTQHAVRRVSEEGTKPLRSMDSALALLVPWYIAIDEDENEVRSGDVSAFLRTSSSTCATIILRLFRVYL
jgi:hypothetical protein